jgi:segregation and condensation protein A
MSYAVHLDNFEGPLDLLLHLIRKHEMDIYDIPMAEITTQYLAIIDTMQSLNLDVAGEFLLMAATLIHIKSRQLLPQVEEEIAEEEELDPRAELVRRLLEYQKYKEAALTLDALPLLDRDVFARKFPPSTAEEDGESELEAIGLYELAEAFRALLQEHPQESFHEVNPEQLSVTDRVNHILSLLDGKTSVSFRELFPTMPSRPEVVVTFLAMLELVKLRLLRLLQTTRNGPIQLFVAVAEPLTSAPASEEALGYR